MTTPTLDDLIDGVKDLIEQRKDGAEPGIPDFLEPVLASLRELKALKEGTPEAVLWQVWVEENGVMVTYGFPYDRADAAHQDAALPLARGQRAEVRPLYPASAIAALRAERDRLREDAERFEYLQNLPVVEAQAFFWQYQSRKQRAKAIDSARGNK